MTWRHFWQIIVAVVCVALFLWMVQSCAPQKNLTEVIQYKDSTIYHHVYDTTRVTVIDSVRVDAATQSESKSETTYTFADGGGTFNATTGEATNVSSVSTKSSQKDNATTSVTATHRADSLAARVDSLTQLNVALQEQLEASQAPAPRPERTGWDKFCSKATIAAIILLVLWLLWKIADYIPALKGYKTIIKTFIKL